MVSLNQLRGWLLNAMADFDDESIKLFKCTALKLEGVGVHCDCDTLQVGRKELKKGRMGSSNEVQHGFFIGVQVLTCRRTS